MNFIRSLFKSASKSSDIVVTVPDSVESNLDDTLRYAILRKDRRYQSLNINQRNPHGYSADAGVYWGLKKHEVEEKIKQFHQSWSGKFDDNYILFTYNVVKVKHQTVINHFIEIDN